MQKPSVAEETHDRKSEREPAVSSAQAADREDQGESGRESTSIDRDPRGAWRLGSLPRDFLPLVILFSLIVMISTVAFRSLLPAPWSYSVQARTSIVRVLTGPEKETKWRIDSATVCRRPALPEELEPYRVNDTRCGGGAWKGYEWFEQSEQTLVLYGPVDTTLEVQQDGTLFISLRERKDGNAPPEARIAFTSGSPDVRLDNNGRLRVNLVFPPGHRDRIFPFSGKTIIGRDVNWAGAGLLKKGHISVYTSDTSADKRVPVDEAELLMGDQVTLEGSEKNKTTGKDTDEPQPKGFARLAPNDTYFDVVAFGRADGVQIERYGGYGYKFRPGWRTALTHDPVLIWVVSILVGFITLAATCAPLFRRET